MLVLTRKSGETIEIGDGITVTVVDLGKGRVKIGIDAPAEVAIRRGELTELPSRTTEEEPRRSPLALTSRTDRRMKPRESGRSSESGEKGGDGADSASCPWPRTTNFSAWPSVALP